MTRTAALAALVAALLFLHPSHRPVAEGAARGASAEDWRAAAKRSQPMIEAGLVFLSKSQNADGSFGGPETQNVRVAVTALGALAFLAHGDVENRGGFQESLARAVKYLLACSQKDGDRAGYFTATGDTVSRMHGQGFATLALAETWGMYGTRRKYASSAEELRKAVTRSIDLIARSQTTNGGWFYQPFEKTNDEGSITVCMIQALRSAREGGFHVPVQTVKDAVDYVHASQAPDGSFKYSRTHDSKTSFELTAAASATLIHAGGYYDRSIRSARDYLWNRSFDDFLRGPSQGYPYYGLLYAVQTLWFDYDQDRMSKHYPKIVDWFAMRFDPATGSFVDGSPIRNGESDYGPVYRTAVACLTLQVPHEILPIFRR